MRGARADRWARWLGAAAGIGLAAAALAQARVPEGGGKLGLDLIVAAAPTGELRFEPAGPVVAAAGMRPGSAAAAGTVEVRNQTGRRLPFRLRALPSTRDADRLLHLRVGSGPRVLYEGDLGGLRRWTQPGLTLGSGERRTLTVRAWIQRGADTGWAGRIVDVPLELRAEGRR